jgi:hypothetical protein
MLQEALMYPGRLGEGGTMMEALQVKDYTVGHQYRVNLSELTKCQSDLEASWGGVEGDAVAASGGDGGSAFG